MDSLQQLQQIAVIKAQDGGSHYHKQQHNQAKDATPLEPRHRELESNIESLILDRPGKPKKTKAIKPKKQIYDQSSQPKASVAPQKTQVSGKVPKAVQNETEQNPSGGEAQQQILNQQAQLASKLYGKTVVQTNKQSVTPQQNLKVQTNERDTDQIVGLSAEKQNIDLLELEYPYVLPSSPPTVEQTPKQISQPHIYEQLKVPTQISARPIASQESRKGDEEKEHDVTFDDTMPQLHLNLDPQPVYKGKPDRNMLQVFESTSEISNSPRYQIRPPTPGIQESVNFSSQPNLGENNQAEKDLLVNDHSDRINVNEPVSLEQAGDIYDQLIDGDISEQDGGRVDESISLAHNLKSEHNLLVLEEIKEEQQSEDSEAVYRQKHQSAPIEPTPSPNKAAGYQTRTTTVQAISRQMMIPVSPLLLKEQETKLWQKETFQSDPLNQTNEEGSPQLVKNTVNEAQKIEGLPSNVEAQSVKDPQIFEPISKETEKQNNALILIQEDPQVQVAQQYHASNEKVIVQGVQKSIEQQRKSKSLAKLAELNIQEKTPILEQPSQSNLNDKDEVLNSQKQGSFSEAFEEFRLSKMRDDKETPGVELAQVTPNQKELMIEINKQDALKAQIVNKPAKVEETKEIKQESISISSRQKSEKSNKIPEDSKNPAISVKQSDKSTGKAKTQVELEADSKQQKQRLEGNQTSGGDPKANLPATVQQKLNNAMNTLKSIKQSKQASELNEQIRAKPKLEVQTNLETEVVDLKLNSASQKDNALGSGPAASPDKVQNDDGIDQKQKFKNAIETLRQLKQDKQQQEKVKSLNLQSSPDVNTKTQLMIDATPTSQLYKAPTQVNTPSPVKNQSNLMDKMKMAIGKKIASPKKDWQDIPSRPASVLKSEKSSPVKKPSLKGRLKAAMKSKVAIPIKVADPVPVGPTKEELVQKINATKLVAEKLKLEAGNINKIFRREDYMKRLEAPGQQLLERQLEDDQFSCFTPKIVFDTDDQKQSLGNKSEIFQKNPKLRRLDSVTDGEQSQIRVDLARIVHRQPLFEKKEQQEYSDFEISKISINKPEVQVLDLPFQESVQLLNLNEFKRPTEEQKSLLSATYPCTKIESEKVHFSTDCETILNAVRKIDHLMFWTFEKHQTCNNIHIQWMKNSEHLAIESDKLQARTFQNFFNKGQNLIYSLNWDLPNDPNIPECQSVEGFPILLNQVLYIQGSQLKVYSLKYRYFQLGEDMLLTQQELGQLSPNFQKMDHYSFSSLYEQIIKQLSYTKAPTEFNFQLVFLQFAFTQEMTPLLVRLETGFSDAIKLQKDAMSALLFKLDKRVRQHLKMRPNHMVRSELIFKSLWQRITPSQDEDTQIALVVKAASAFKLEEASSCTETAKPYDGVSIEAQSADFNLKLVVGRHNPASTLIVQVPKQRNTRYSPEVVKHPTVVLQQTNSMYGSKYKLVEIEQDYRPVQEDRNNKKETKYDQLDFTGADKLKPITTFKGGNTDQKLGTVNPIILPEKQIFGRDKLPEKEIQTSISMKKDQTISVLKQYKDTSIAMKKDQTTSLLNQYKDIGEMSKYNSQSTQDGNGHTSYQRAPFVTRREQDNYGFQAIPSLQQSNHQQSFYTQSIRKLDLQKAQLRQLNGLELNPILQTQRLTLEPTENRSTGFSKTQRYLDGALSPANQTFDVSLLSPKTQDRENIWKRKLSDQLSQDSNRVMFPEINEHFGQNEWFAKAMLQKGMPRRSQRPY